MPKNTVHDFCYHCKKLIAVFRQICIPFLLLTGLLLAGQTAFAQKDKLEGLWYNETKSAKVRIFKATNGKFYGKVEWLAEPDGKNGKPKTDANNPDKSKRSEPILGLIIMKGFHTPKNDVYEGGTIYDPNNGKTYSCKITHKGNTLDVRGYIGISMIGRTTVWSRAD